MCGLHLSETTRQKGFLNLYQIHLNLVMTVSSMAPDGNQQNQRWHFDYLCLLEYAAAELGLCLIGRCKQVKTSDWLIPAQMQDIDRS